MFMVATLPKKEKYRVLAGANKCNEDTDCGTIPLPDDDNDKPLPLLPFINGATHR